MSLPSVSPATSAHAASAHLNDMRLHGRWLLLARSGWVVVIVTLVVLNIISFQDSYTMQFTPQVMQELHRLNFSPTLYGILGTAGSVLFQVVYLALGLLLFLRRSDDRMALFCAYTLVLLGGALPLYDFNSEFIIPSLGNNPVLRAITLLLFAMAEVAPVLFFYIFPSGRFAPRWTRWCAVLVVAFWLLVIFFPALPAGAGGPAVPLFLLSAVVAQVYRYRRVSTPRERQQTKWAVFGFALAILIFVAFTMIGFLVPQSVKDANPLVGNLVIGNIVELAFLLIPIFIAIAILRARLWDIDTLINKALVYGSLTVLLAALYAGLILGLASLAGAIGGQTASNPLVLVVSTLAIAALFQPLRKRLQSVIDRRFYRKKYDAEKTLAAFSATLRQEVDLNDLRQHLLAVVTETMQPAHASLWLRQSEQPAAGQTSLKEINTL